MGRRGTGGPPQGGPRQPPAATLAAAWPTIHAGAFVILYAVAACIGRTTVLEGSDVSLTWPAAGVGVLWLMTTRGRRWTLLNGGLLVAVTVVVNASTGTGPALCAVFAVGNLTQAAAVAAILRLLAPRLWGFGGTEAFTSTRNLVALVVAAAVGSLVGAAAGSLGLWVVRGETPAEVLLLTWGRYSTGSLAVTALGHLWAHRWRHREDPLGPAVRGVAGRWEAAALVVTSAAAYLLVFGWADPSLSFLLIAFSVWAGLRLCPGWACVHSVAAGVLGIGLTLQGAGPFSATGSPEAHAAVVQLFGALVLVVAMVLATSRAEREEVLQELRTTQREARARADLWEAVADSMTDGVMLVTAAGDVVSVNDAARAPASPVHWGDLDARATRLRHPDGTPLTWDELPSQRALRELKVPAQDVTAIKPDGSRSVLSIGATALEDVAPYGQGRGAVVVYRDVTDERDRADQLASFAGTAAHDLRGPLTALTGWLELATSHVQTTPTGDPALARMLERAGSAASRMRELIADLLSHATSQGDALELADLDLRAVLTDVSVLHGLTDEVVVGPVPPVHADEAQMRQLFSNLIGNAVKYVAPGVTPQIRIRGGLHHGDVRVEVTDNGIGIPEEQRTAVFSRLHRAHTDRPEYVGTGMGLAICKLIVDRHGGRISVAPAPVGSGSTFVITLPAAAGAEARWLEAEVEVEVEAAPA
ncbi:ATP-binding protein [Nocardioides sp. SYSU DS0663]|uniref:ATP-binding protein n=1 Tax=Nocardioides sp. SYSU DS0663 TaxID=3416445 RepID=UPI003F4C637D